MFCLRLLLTAVSVASAVLLQAMPLRAQQDPYHRKVPPRVAPAAPVARQQPVLRPQMQRTTTYLRRAQESARRSNQEQQKTQNRRQLEELRQSQERAKQQQAEQERLRAEQA